MDLTGIHNIGEFYSHHYLDALLDGDLKGLFARWREEDAATPDKRLAGLATDFFAAKGRALRERRPAERYQASHAFHVELLEALGYTYSFGVRYLLDGAALPVLSTLRRDGREYVWIVETPFAGPDDAPLEQGLLSVQFPAGSEAEGLLHSPLPWEELIGEVFRGDEPPRWLLLLAGRHVYLLDRTKWGLGQYLLFDLDELFGRRQREALRAAAALLSRGALCPDDGLPLHDTLDENSHKHAHAVSSDLKYGVRRAVELLANEYVWQKSRTGRLARDGDLARRLTGEALRYLYRLLFLFYAEARGAELEVTPMRSEAYRTGYSLEMLRDLEQAPLATPQAQNGTFIDATLRRLFALVNEGFGQEAAQLALPGGEQLYHQAGFSLPGLRSRLFDPASTPLLSSVPLRNVVLQEVIQLLSLSREGRGKKGSRGRISYVQLGINQLGAVYEGLLSYSGFFARETLYEVKPAAADAADETSQTYFVPESELKRYEPDEFVYVDGPDGSRVRKSYPKDSFIFRLAGRDREKSASYYTPEVLTQCVVKYSLKELLQGKTADEILGLLVCEMALGSGAFGNEAINQLADAYLERKQAELGIRLSADDYRVERQRVKAYLAVNNFYGVDLNPTAVELAQVSLWLNILHPGAAAPWFSPRLAVGNSLVGARRQVYRAEDVASGAYREKAPEGVDRETSRQVDKVGKGGAAEGASRFTPHASRPPGSVYHFLLPDAGMAAFDGDKVIKELAPAQVQAIKAWRKDFTAKISADELRNLQALSDRVDALWAAALRERQTLLARTRQSMPVWGQPNQLSMFNGQLSIANARKSGAASALTIDNSQLNIDNSSPFPGITAAEKELAYLYRPTGPTRRLKLAMDYWCSLWFWPIPEAGSLSTRKQFLDDLNALLQGDEAGYEPLALAEQRALWDEDEELGGTGGTEGVGALRRSSFIIHPSSLDVDVLQSENPRLKLAAAVAGRMRFFHWELAFPEVFAERGGFDLTVGNPPWIKVAWSDSGLLADSDATLAIRKENPADLSLKRTEILEDSTALQEYYSVFVEQTGQKSLFNSGRRREVLSKVQPNLYKVFLCDAWTLVHHNGVVGFVHEPGIYEDAGGGDLRAYAYQRLRYYFRFYNQLNLFPEESLGHARPYCVSIFGTSFESPHFMFIANLFHPRTVDACFDHDGFGQVPPLKTPSNDWDLTGHRYRIITCGSDELDLFAKLFEPPDTPLEGSRLPILHSIADLNVLRKFSTFSVKLADKRAEYHPTVMLDESAAQKKGWLKREVMFPVTPQDLVISGPHYYVGNPHAKTPRENCASKGDYDGIDLTSIVDSYLPRTVFRPYRASEYVTEWDGRPISQRYRYANRRRGNPGVERTLISCILPPGPPHIDSTFSIAFRDTELLVEFAGLTHSICYDYFVRSTGKNDFRHDVVAMLPLPTLGSSRDLLTSRTLRLNCLTTHYADLWQELYDPAFNRDGWSRADARLRSWSDLTPHWQRDVALRTPFERRQALVEIDVLASLALGLTLEELLTIYRVQFPVLQENERRLRFDQRGMEVPVRTVQGELVIDEAHERFAAMIPPFTPVDREADYRAAWAYFELTQSRQERQE